MATLFVESLNANLALAWIICIVLILRLMYKRVSKRLCLGLWVIVGMRCLLPVRFCSVFSCLPSSQFFNPKDIYKCQFKIYSGINFIDDCVNDYLGDHYFEGISVPNEMMLKLAWGGTVVWIVGMIVLTAMLVMEIVIMRRRLCTAVIYERNIWQSDMIQVPFVFGILKPKIYVPFDLKNKEFSLVVFHEQEHIRHGDHLWKFLFYLILIVHWYNPMMWVAYKKISDDLELACDERVICKIGEDERNTYAATLLNYAARTSLRFSDRLYFGCENIRYRIQSIVNHKTKEGFLIVIFSLMLLVVAFSMLTDPNPTANNNLLDVLQIRI